jgi:hypothetical protein
MHSTEPRFTNPAMDVIRRTDPGLYEHMQADATWTVHVLRDYDTEAGSPLLDDEDRRQLTGGDAIGYSSGETFPLGKDTFLGVPSLQRAAADDHVSLAEATAAVLVHEYVHHLRIPVLGHQDDEIHAERAELAFDRELPDGKKAAAAVRFAETIPPELYE